MPDLIVHNATIYTQDVTRPWAEAAAMRNGRFLAVGSNDTVRALADPDTQLLDAGGRLLLPGFIDAHVHFLQQAIRNQQLNLFGVASLQEVLRQVAEAAARAAPGDWIQGWGWDENLWDAMPHAGLLDAIAPANPVVLSRMDMHSIWINSAAMARAGIDRETPDPPESLIERDPVGNPTGILREWNAIALVTGVVPRPDEDSLRSWLEATIRDAHRLGITGIHDQRVEREGRRSFQLWQSLRLDNALPLRVHMNLAADFLPQIGTLGLQPGFGDDRLWLGHIKAFSDGTLGSRTAWMLEPFANESDNYGLAVTSTAEMSDLAARATRAGFALSVHAIGDRAVREVIDVMAEWPAPVGGLPHRIEHVQLLHPEDIARLAHHDIAASMQPIHLRTDWAPADRLWGERARYTYAFRALLDAGTLLAFGSDAPVAPMNPLAGIATAVTRQDDASEPANGWYPQERISVAEAVRAYTLAPAQLSGKAHVQGRIAPGYWADCVLLGRNIFEIPADDLAATPVEWTIHAGQVVYRSDA